MKQKLFFSMFYILTIFLSSINAQKKDLKNEIDIINTTYTYVSRDTLSFFDERFKDEITINLIKFNKNKTVQVSREFAYNKEEFELNNSNVTDLLDKQTSYSFEYKGKSKIVIKCFAKYGKRAWNDFATAGSKKINEKFIIKGDTLIRKSKWQNVFGKTYILDKTLSKNHKNIAIGNGCL